MKIFLTNLTDKHWHYLNLHNVQRYLAPTYLSSRYIAFCPYCKNPITALVKPSYNARQGIALYAKHLAFTSNHSLEVNEDTKKHCLLRANNVSFIPCLTKTFNYNFPFALLIATKEICLNNRKVASPNIIDAIKTKSLYFDVFEDKQVSYRSNYKATLWMIFKLLPQDKKNNWPKMQITLEEKQYRDAHVIYSFKTYCKLSKNLVQQI